MTDFPDNPFSDDAEFAHKVALTYVLELFSHCVRHAIVCVMAEGMTREDAEVIGRLTNFAVRTFGNKNPETLTVGEAYDIAISCKTEGRTYIVEVDELIISKGGNDGDITATEVLDDLLAVLA